ncbi:TF29 protein, partial [Ptilonorhynchus violaceus]|nr:TF29 protein [Ptilonorhynchus violaceus]
IHMKTHWGTQALCDQFLRSYGCVGVYELAKRVTEGCLICQRVNRKVMRKHVSSGMGLAMRPFQCIQVDFTEFPQVQRWRYLLVIVDHLTHWVEVVPTTKTTVNAVAKVILEQIVPRYGMVNRIDSDRGIHFTSRVLQQVTRSRGIEWRLHTPWHPQSSGRVERMNQSLKSTITKLMLETNLSWVKCLPLALLRIQTQQRSDLGASPYEMMFGLPFLISQQEVAIYEGREARANKYVQIIAKNLGELRSRGLLAQTTSLDFKIHHINPGDWVLVKT